jgi:hypothetical protein
MKNASGLFNPDDGLNKVASRDSGQRHTSAWDPASEDNDFAEDDPADLGEEFLSDALPLLAGAGIALLLVGAIVLAVVL